MQLVKEQNRHWVHFSNCNLVMKYKYHELYNISLSVSIDRGAKPPQQGQSYSIKWAVYFLKGNFPTYFNLFLSNNDIKNP